MKLGSLYGKTWITGVKIYDLPTGRLNAHLRDIFIIQAIKEKKLFAHSILEFI
jgi:hypothetical protein